MKIKVVAIVPAAGLGKRFGTSVRKTFVSLRGDPLLIHTLKRLHAVKSITEIIPVLRQQDVEKVYEMAETYKLDKIRRIAAGGRKRQDSIYNALKLLKEEIHDGSRQSSIVNPNGTLRRQSKCMVLIHDGARPIISGRLIEKLLHEIKGVDGVAPGIPVKETLKEVGANDMVVSTVKREKFRTIQTPQVFPVEVIKKAYDKAYAEGFYATDDAALVEKMGGKVKIIAGSPFNVKVTTLEDLELVEYLLSKKDLS